jgi:hypothetical protein
MLAAPGLVARALIEHWMSLDDADGGSATSRVSGVLAREA